MHNERNKIDDLVEHVESYIEIQQQLTQLKIAEKSSIIGASMLSAMIVGSFLLLVFLFTSIALAFLFANYLGKVYLGFFAVAGIYFFIALVLMMMKESLLKVPIANIIIKNFFKENQHD